MLKVLSAQASISLEIATLYRDLEESASRYRSLIENAQEAIFVVHDGYFKFLNPRTTSMTGYSSEELLSQPFEYVIHPDDRKMVLENYFTRLAGEHSPNVYAFRIVTKDSVYLWGQLNSVLIDWEGKPATLNFLTDITELKRAADIHAKTERLNAIAELAGGVAHNFNNMLQVLMAGAQLALSDLETGNTSQMRNSLERILQSSRLGAETVKRLQGFANIRNHRTIL